VVPHLGERRNGGRSAGWVSLRAAWQLGKPVPYLAGGCFAALTRKKWKIFFDLYQEEKILFIPGDRLPDGGNSQ
jgi:hypothetical protein